MNDESGQSYLTFCHQYIGFKNKCFGLQVCLSYSTQMFYSKRVICDKTVLMLVAHKP